MPKSGRFDADAFFAALDAERQSRQLTWKRVADEAGVSASTLTRMAQGRRPDVDSLAALATWAGLSSDQFVRAEGTERNASSLAMISTYLKSDPQLTPEAADALTKVIQATYDLMAEKD